VPISTRHLDGLLVVLDGLKGVADLLRNVGLAEASHALKAAVGHDGHDSRDHRDVDTDLSAVGHKLNEPIDVVEELCDNELAPRVDLRASRVANGRSGAS
jgi:hypothetical protein